MPSYNTQITEKITMLIADTNSRANNINIRVREHQAPAMFAIVEGVINLTTFEDAEYIYVNTTKGAQCNGKISMQLFKTTVLGYSISTGKTTHKYYKVDQMLPSNNKAILALISRYFCEQTDNVLFDDPTNISNMFRQRTKSSDTIKRGTVEISKLPITKITAQHHEHFRAIEVMKSIGEARCMIKYKEVLNMPFEIHDSMMASILLWCSSIKEDEYKAIVATKIFNSGSYVEFAKMGKQISTEAKSMQNLTTRDLRSFFELDVLVNRVDGILDWEKEKKNRTQPQYAQMPKGFVLEQASKIFSEARMKGKKPKHNSWSDYWDSRWQWSAAGSIHSQYQDDMNYVSKQRELKNKFIAISTMPSLKMEYFSNRSQNIHAWSSYKYEWGKLRAIYGTDLTSYVLANFAFYNCENLLPDQFPVGKNANDKNVSARVSAILNYKIPMCIDYEDFNSQHSGESMADVIQAYYDVFSKDMSEEQRLATKWTKESIKSLIVHDNMGTKTTYEAEGTLLSGWRLTTFMNSVLNYIYTKHICGKEMPFKNSLHNGDDVILGVNNLKIAQTATKLAIKSKVRLQRSKCAFAGIAEFLRVDHIRGSKGQYITRACATLAHSRIESKMSTDARDLIESMESRLNDCWYRGMDIKMISKLRHTYYQRQAVICDMHVNDMYIIKTTHRAGGGISTATDSRTDKIITSGLNDRGEIELPNLPGINAYAYKISKSLELKVPVSQVVKKLKQATYNAVLEKKRKVTISETKDDWYLMMKALYKAHKGGISVANFGKAALTGLALELLSDAQPGTALTTFLKNSKRPIEALQMVI